MNTLTLVLPFWVLYAAAWTVGFCLYFLLGAVVGGLLAREDPRDADFRIPFGLVFWPLIVPVLALVGLVWVIANPFWRLALWIGGIKK